MSTQRVSSEEQQRESVSNGDRKDRRKKKKEIYGGLALLLLVAVVIIAYPKVTEEIAYARGIEAYAYGLPLVMMDVSNQVMTDASKSGDSRAPINQFWRISALAKPWWLRSLW